MVRRRIAVVGSGITGLAAARALAASHDVDVFEAGSVVGGHARSVRAGGVDVDTGFIVFNEVTYPRFAALVRELGLESRPTDMTFSLRCERCGLEYGSGSFRSLFAQRRNVLSPAHLRLLGGILRFFRAARRDLAGGWLGDLSLGAYFERRAVPVDVARHCVVPMTAAIWSANAAQVPAMHAAMVLGFLLRHGFLGFRNDAWRTVRGGCRAYLQRLVTRLGAEVLLHTPVRRIRREPDAVVVEADGRPPARYDRAVLATHTDTSLALLADPTDDERRILGAIRYGRHESVVHTDETRLPRRVAARSSWNYRVRDCAARDARLEVTYWLDRLQGIVAPGFRCVTLNPDPPIDAGRVVTTHDDAHPVLDVGAVVARRELPLIQGARGTFFCGAWQYDGFHEDGLRSGLEAAALAGAGQGALVA
jgi:predicted NAD/FAD-binding protein